MQKVVGFFSKPENLFVLTLLIGLFTGTYKVVSKASNHNNSLYQRVSSPICFYLRLFGYEVKTFETERGKENGRTSDHHLEHRRNEAAPTREQRSSGGARSSDPIQRR